MTNPEPYPFTSTRLDICEQRARYAYDNISWTRAVHEHQAEVLEGRRKAIGILSLISFVTAGICILFDCFLDVLPVQLCGLGFLVVGLYFDIVLRVRSYGRLSAQESHAAHSFLRLQRSAMNVLSTIEFGELDAAEASELVNHLELDYQQAVEAAGILDAKAMRGAEKVLSRGANGPHLEAGEAFLPSYLKESATSPAASPDEEPAASPTAAPDSEPNTSTGKTATATSPEPTSTEHIALAATKD